MSREQAMRRWASLVAAMWAAIFSTHLSFANYSAALKETMAINQKHLNGLSIAIDVGDSLSIFPGLLIAHLPPWTLLCLGASFGVLGYGTFWLVVSRTVSSIPYYCMVIAAIVAGNSVMWTDVTMLTISLRNFRHHRGPTTGLLKGCMGLSAAVFSNLCSFFLASSSSTYLLMLVILPTVCCLIASIFLRPVQSIETVEEHKAERKILFVFNTIAFALAVYLVIINVIPKRFKEAVAYIAASWSTFLAIVLAPALALVIAYSFNLRTGDYRSITRTSLAEGHNDVVDSAVARDARKLIQPLLDDTSMSEIGFHRTLDDTRLGLHGGSNPNYGGTRKGEESEELTQRRTNWWGSLSCFPFVRADIGLGQDRPTFSLFKEWHFYLLYFSILCGTGTGITFISNLGQVAQALDAQHASPFTSLFSLGNFFGRLASGFLSEQCFRAFGMPRPTWMGIAKVPMIIAFLWLSSGSIMSLYMGSLIIGFCVGSHYMLYAPIISELYGLRYFGTNLTIFHLIQGSYFFSSIAGYLYDKQAMSQSKDDTLSCYGSSCFHVTFQILACALTLALFCDIVIALISYSTYNNLTFVKK